MRGAPGTVVDGTIRSHNQWFRSSVIVMYIVRTGTAINEITHQYEIPFSWWVYCKTNNSQNADINAIHIYSIFAQIIFSGIRTDAASNPENKAQPPADNINKI